MSLNWESIVVGVVVAVALLWGVRAAWRSVRGGSACSDCGDSGSCPLVENPELLEEIHRRNASGGLEPCQPGHTTCKELAASLEVDPVVAQEKTSD